MSNYKKYEEDCLLPVLVIALESQFMLSKAIDVGHVEICRKLVEFNAAIADVVKFFRKAGFNPDQPRVPAGNPDGGQWSDGGGSGGGSHSFGDSIVDNSPRIRVIPVSDLRPSHSSSVSNRGVRFITHHEGFSHEVYKDAAGYLTIGYGHKLSAGESYPNGITREQALKLLANDLNNTNNAIRNVRVELNQHQVDAMTSFIFNVGERNFRNSTLLQLLNRGDYSGAADQLLLWDKVTINGVKKPNRGLSIRRNAERELFLHGKY